MVPQMSPVSIPEELLASVSTLPEQFRDIWHRTRAISAERSLILSVLWQAVLDLHKYRFAKRRRQQLLYMEAYQWVACEDRRWPFSFVNLCEMLALSPEALRDKLLGDAAPLQGAGPVYAKAEVEEAA